MGVVLGERGIWVVVPGSNVSCLGAVEVFSGWLS